MTRDHNANFISDVKPLLSNCRCRFSDLPSGMANGDSISLDKSVNFPLLGLNLYGKSTQGYATTGGTPKGKNLLDVRSLNWSQNAAINIVMSDTGVSFETTSDGTGQYRFISCDITHLVTVGKTYTISQIMTGSDNAVRKLSLQKRANDGSTISAPLVSTITVEADALYWLVSNPWGATNAEVPAGSTVTYDNIQLEEGSTATAYEPYKGSPNPSCPVPIVSVGDDGELMITVNNNGENKLTAAITSALPLCGLPVTEDGNYTDSNGQQWACDELIYNADGTGKVVKRATVETVTSASSMFADSKVDANGGYAFMFYLSHTPAIVDSVSVANMYCSHIETIRGAGAIFNNPSEKAECGISGTGSYLSFRMNGFNTKEAVNAFLTESPMTIVYEIAPEEIELTAAEMQQLHELMSYNGLTNVFNDEGADMSVSACTNQVLADEVLPIIDYLKSRITDLEAQVAENTSETETDPTETVTE